MTPQRERESRQKISRSLSFGVIGTLRDLEPIVTVCSVDNSVAYQLCASSSTFRYPLFPVFFLLLSNCLITNATIPLNSSSSRQMSRGCHFGKPPLPASCVSPSLYRPTRGLPSATSPTSPD